MTPRTATAALVLSGGVGLGAYQAGAYAALAEAGTLQPAWISGASVGALNAALIAGGTTEGAVERLRRFWLTDASHRVARGDPAAALRRPLARLSAIFSGLADAPGFFRRRLPTLSRQGLSSIYDIAPTRGRLELLVDFERLNLGFPRVAVTATDLETGEALVFDTARGDRLTMEHLIGSCGFVPAFPATEIDGRQVGDGGFSANAPLLPLLEEDEVLPEILFVVELFPRDGSPPEDSEAGLERAIDLLFTSQTALQLRTLERVAGLRRKLAAARGEEPHPSTTVVHLSYRPRAVEAGAAKTLDFSAASLSERWLQGRLDMQEALLRLSRPGFEPGGILRIRRVPADTP